VSSNRTGTPNYRRLAPDILGRRSKLDRHLVGANLGSLERWREENGREQRARRGAPTRSL